ncbi:phytoene desaturase family protein [Paenibacillus massiliensis]|uniref:phytoene desaturase family protein n=1 Tax=Paenibacillus massiliensis TaxID=225917 RepID=UPI00037E7F3F
MVFMRDGVMSGKSAGAIVIGGGIGGLSCAIRLAAGGVPVKLLEKQPRVGGKLQRVELEGYHFDRGPSTITMPDAFRAVFASAGARLEDYCELYELEPRTRNIFADGTIVDLSKDRVWMKEQIASYSTADARRYDAFMREATALYREADARFLHKLLLGPRDKLNMGMLRGLLRVRPWLTLHKLLRRYFSHPHTLAMFGRYATYVGSSPYQSPSIFAMMAHLEGDLGVYGVRGGTSALVDGLEQLAMACGVEIMTGTEVERIVVINGKIQGVETTAGFYPSSLVIANGDVLSVNSRLLASSERPSMSDASIAGYEPSLSGFVTLAGIPRQYELLRHHTVFFPENYEQEFESIFVQKQPPVDPTIYICYSGYSEAGLAPPDGSNLFILTNAPYVSAHWNWEQEAEAYRARLLRRLAACGIDGLEHADVLLSYTPEQLAADTYAHRGAIYGISSNSVRQTFARPGNRSRDVEGLWYVGGTTHPGGGTPIVALSGQLVAERILQERT